MADFAKHDLEMLRYYVGTDNRELYFNYLAQMEGNDGYGTLALGVVRNDNAPGATANHFAQAQGGEKALHLGERGWQKVGEDLIEQDFILREGHFNNQRPDLALNLPVRDVQLAHDRTFALNDIRNEAWTPRQLLEAARRQGGEPEAEKVWSMMLDNQLLGLTRGASTTENLAHRYNDEKLDATAYVAAMGLARTNAGLFPTPNSDPDKIDRDGKTYSFHAESGTWSGPAPIESRIAIKLPVTDPALIEALNDSRALRQEREQLRTQFHPDDPNRSRPIQASPWLFTDASPAQEPSNATMQARITGAADPTEPEHPRHALYQQCIEGVHALDARLGRAPDQHSARMVASLTTLAVSSGLERVDHVLLSVRGTETAAGERVFVVQGDPGDPAHQRAHMPTEQATSTSTKQSFQQLAALDLHQEREQAQQLQREQDVPARAVPLMHS